MNHFTKTAVALALLAGASAANATVAYDQGGSNEAYLSAYDFTTGKTFTFDTGVSYNTLLANVSNAAYSLDFDLSGDSNWQNFITGATTSAIKYVVAVGNTVDFGAAVTSNSPLTAGAENSGIYFGYQTASAIQNHAIEVNSGLVVNNALNVSKLALDSDSPGTGQHANADSVWGSWIQDPQADYGQAIGFQLGQLDQTDGHNIATTFGFMNSKNQFVPKVWMLAGNSLTYTSAVPVPGAVWLFGSALMGFVGINRRKAIKA